MRLREIRQSQVLPIPLEQAWAFFSNPANLNEITPPDMRFQTLGGDLGSVHPGQLIWYRLKLAPLIYRTWVTEIKQVVPGEYFLDEQRFGPYKLWHHRHTLRAVSETQTEVSDHVIYALPFWPLSEIAHALYVQPMHEKVFRYRQQELVKRFGS